MPSQENDAICLLARKLAAKDLERRWENSRDNQQSTEYRAVMHRIVELFGKDMTEFIPAIINPEYKNVIFANDLAAYRRLQQRQ